VFPSDRSGTLGGQDIYVATRDSTADPWSAPVNPDGAINNGAAETRLSLSWDAQTLYSVLPRGERWASGPTGLPHGSAGSLAGGVYRDAQWACFGCFEERGVEHGRLGAGVVGAVNVTVPGIDERLSCRVWLLVAGA
jgi:hypothetical protein